MEEGATAFFGYEGKINNSKLVALSDAAVFEALSKGLTVNEACEARPEPLPGQRSSALRVVRFSVSDGVGVFRKEVSFDYQHPPSLLGLRVFD